MAEIILCKLKKAELIFYFRENDGLFKNKLKGQTIFIT